MTPEVGQRLKELTVDPANVKIIDPNAPKTDGGNTAAADVNGKWIISVDAGGQVHDLAVEFKQTGSEFIGSMASMVGNGSFEKGKVTGNTITATLNADVQGNPTVIAVDGKIDGDKMTGTMNVPGIGVVAFTAVKQN